MINSLITRKFRSITLSSLHSYFRHSQSNGILWKKCATQPPGIYISLIKVEGLLVPYIVINFDIVNSGTSVQRYAYLKPSTDEIHHFSSITH